ncbi:hypothetical protein HMPREF0645_0879, partial [Hallella bergensis DSM 17361]
ISVLIEKALRQIIQQKMINIFLKFKNITRWRNLFKLIGMSKKLHTSLTF